MQTTEAAAISAGFQALRRLSTTFAELAESVDRDSIACDSFRSKVVLDSLSAINAQMDTAATLPLSQEAPKTPKRMTSMDFM